MAASYAKVSDVRARMGRLQKAFGDATSPGEVDLEIFLVNASREVDAELAARGLSQPVTSEAALGGLVDPTANRAALLALRGRFPASEGPAAATELIRSLEKDWDRFVASIASGTHSVVKITQVDTGLPELSATSFAVDEPDYGRHPLTPAEKEHLSPSLAPVVERGQQF